MNEKIVISKSDKKNDMYDILFFVSRDIEYIQIPSFIKIIAPFALEGSCSSFIEFSEDSNLEIIDKYGFAGVPIISITIPKRVTTINKGAFCGCDELKFIEIPEDSELQKIGKKAFKRTEIERIEIPSSLVQLESGWCDDMDYLVKFNVSKNNKCYSNFQNDFILGKTNRNNQHQYHNN